MRNRRMFASGTENTRLQEHMQSFIPISMGLKDQSMLTSSLRIELHSIFTGPTAVLFLLDVVGLVYFIFKGSRISMLYL